MTVSQLDPVNNYAGNGSTTIFDFDFLIEEENQLLVQHTNSLGVQATLIYDIDYTINQIGIEGGSHIIFPKEGSEYGVLSSDEILSLSLSLPIEQEKEIKNSQKLSLITLEWCLDYITRLIQVLNRKIERSVKVQEGSSKTADELIESLQQAQINANNSAVAANNSAIEAEQQAVIATQKGIEIQEIFDEAAETIEIKTSESVARVESEGQYQFENISAKGVEVNQNAQTVLAEIAQGLDDIDVASQNGLAAISEAVVNIDIEKNLAINEIRETGYGVTPSNCKNITITKQGENRLLKWQDPDDTIINNQVLSSWRGTKIVRQISRYPLNTTDGEIILDNKNKNAYLNTALTITDEDGRDFYYAAFPYSVNNAVNLDSKNRFNDAIIYEFLINPNDSNPDTRVTVPVGAMNYGFSNASMNFTTGVFNWGSWQNAFFQPRPVMLKSDGSVDYEIYKPDFAYKADGVTPSDIANQNYDGNVMIGFPQVWFKYVMDGSLQHVYIANKKVDDDYKCYTHYNKLGILLEEIYLMAYQPCNISSKLRSLSGKTIFTNNAGTTEITYAQANGQSWHLWDYAMFNMINMLLTLMCGSTNIQAKFGEGRSSAANATTGECNANGMFFGTSGNGKLKIFGIENCYGNYWKRTAGCVYTPTGMKYKMTESTIDGSGVVGYNTDGTGYLTHQTFSGTSAGYISQAALSSNGIFPTVASGSATTYFADGLWWANGGYAIVGGAYDGGSSVGAFALYLGNPVSYAYPSIGASLSCKPL